MPTEEELRTHLDVLNAELDRRAERHRKVEPYFEIVPGRSPIPPIVRQAKTANSYRSLMGMSETPWGRVIVNSKLDRLEVTGIHSEDEAVDRAVWGWWQDEAMDLESKLAHSSALLDGRVHALVWPRSTGPRRGQPRVTLDDATQMVVQYEEGSRRDRVAALRRWVDDEGVLHATLYRPEAIYKFWRKASEGVTPHRSGGAAPAGWDEQAARPAEPVYAKWERRDVRGESWPLRNPFGVVPVVELAVNRRLKPGTFAHARGEFEDVIGLMDRINLLTYLGLIVAVWQGFPLRGIIGAKVMEDDDGNPMPPFESRPDSVAHILDESAKTFEFKAGERGNLSVFGELTELAAATSTPRHYLPMEGGISNVSEPTIRAFEGGMHATVNASHKPSLGEGWEDVKRLGGMMLPEPVTLSPRAATQWADHESRSLGERADAALKLSQSQLPWQGVAELALNLSQDQIARYAAEAAGSAFGDLLREATVPPVAAVEGNGGVPAA